MQDGNKVEIQKIERVETMSVLKEESSGDNSFEAALAKHPKFDAKKFGEEWIATR